MTVGHPRLPACQRLHNGRARAAYLRSVMDDEMVLELRKRLDGVVAEVRAELDTSRWKLLPKPRIAARVHAAAGLAHCCALADDLVSAHRAGSEMTARLLARAIFEAWVTSYYIALGGWDALERVGGAYVHALEQQVQEVARHDEGLRSARKKARRRNKKIAELNAGLAVYNQRNPDTPKPLVPEVPTPAGTPIGIATDLARRIPKGAVARRLPLREMVAELQRLTHENGHEETFEAAYHMAYRSLSAFGSHATIAVLDSYLDDRGGMAQFISVTPVAQAPTSFEIPNLQMVLLLLAGLATEVLGTQGAPCTAAREGAAFVTEVVHPPGETIEPDND